MVATPEAGYPEMSADEVWDEETVCYPVRRTELFTDQEIRLCMIKFVLDDGSRYLNRDVSRCGMKQGPSPIFRRS